MIARVVHKNPMQSASEIKANLHYWLSKPAEERIAAVEALRRQQHGSAERLQRTARVVQRT